MIITPNLIFMALLGSSPVKGLPVVKPLHRRAIEAWIETNPSFRIAGEGDCGDCIEQVQSIRKGMGGAWKAIPNYHPYYQVGDFNGDGQQDFAIAVVSSSKSPKRFKILVFNGPFTDSATKAPAFASEPKDLSFQGMFFGPPRPKPYRLVVGPFESEGMLLVPKGPSYLWER